MYKSKEESTNEAKSKQFAIEYKENDDDSDDQEVDKYEVDMHNVGLYIEKIHKITNEVVDPQQKKLDSLRKLRKLVKK